MEQGCTAFRIGFSDLPPTTSSNMKESRWSVISDYMYFALLRLTFVYLIFRMEPTAFERREKELPRTACRIFPYHAHSKSGSSDAMFIPTWCILTSPQKPVIIYLLGQNVINDRIRPQSLYRYHVHYICFILYHTTVCNFVEFCRSLLFHSYQTVILIGVWRSRVWFYWYHTLILNIFFIIGIVLYAIIRSYN